MWGNFLCRIRQFTFISWNIPIFKIFFRMVCIILIIYSWVFSAKIYMPVAFVVLCASNFGCRVMLNPEIKTKKISNNKHDWTTIKYLNVLRLYRTQKQLQHFFLNILQKYYQLLILDTSISSNNTNFDLYLHAKKELHLELLFSDIVQILQTCYFGYFENAWSCPSLMIVSPCRKLWCSKCLNQLVGNFGSYLKAKN